MCGVSISEHNNPVNPVNPVKMLSFSCLKSGAKHGSQGGALRQWQHGPREAASLFVGLSGAC